MLLFIKVTIFYCLGFILISYHRTDGISSILSKASNILFCNKIFLEDDINEFLDELRFGIKGQPFVRNNILPALRSHFAKKTGVNKSAGPLVFRFDGPIGVGKSLVADRFMKSHFFRNKHFIHVKAASVLNTPQQINKYKVELKQLIETSLLDCRRAVFVFDDVNEIVSNVLLSLPPFQIHPNIDYSESVFIYISQMGSEDIEEATSLLLQEGVSRNSLKLDQFMEVLKKLISKKEGILKQLWSGMVELWSSGEAPLHNGHEFYIPFLPLDTFTVKSCIEKEANALNVKLSKRIIEEILLNVGCPTREDSGLCSSGCKLVSSKLPLVLAEHDEL